MSIKSIRKAQNLKQVTFLDVFYENEKCCLLCSLVCVFMFFMLVKLFRKKKKKKSKICPDNLHYHTTNSHWAFKVNKTTRCEICSKLTITNQIDVFISHFVLVFPRVTKCPLWIWPTKCSLGDVTKMKLIDHLTQRWI